MVIIAGNRYVRKSKIVGRDHPVMPIAEHAPVSVIIRVDVDRIMETVLGEAVTQPVIVPVGPLVRPVARTRQPLRFREVDRREVDQLSNRHPLERDLYVIHFRQDRTFRGRVDRTTCDGSHDLGHTPL